MLDANLSERIGKIVSFGTILTCVLVTPKLALDPINLPKMVALAITAGVVLGMLFSARSSLTKSGSKSMFWLLIAFFSTLAISVALSDQRLTQGIYGTHGRNTGFITYFAFIVLLFVSFHISNQRELTRFLKALYIAGILSAGYGLLQFLGVDPAGWDIYGSPVVGFLGNSDFQSAFLAVFAAAAFSQGILDQKNRWLNLILTIFAMLIVYLTHAKQGLIAFLVGASISILVLAIKKNSKAMISLYFLFAGTGISFIILGLRDLGPIGHLIYKSSLEARFYYWQAATRAFKDNLLFGLGLDAFGDYYGRYRTAEAVAWNTQPTNAAHNIFLDYAANGGLIFLCLNLIIVGLVLRTFMRVVVKDRNFNYTFIALFSGWAAFQAQSIISINQIGLAVWNWVISGLLIGYVSNQKIGEAIPTPHKSMNKKSQNRRKPQPQQVPNAAILGGLIGFVILAVVTIPAFSGSVKYWNAINSQNLKTIESAAYIWPRDEYKYWSVILTVSGNATAIDENSPNPNPLEIQKQIDDLNKMALEITKNAIKDFPQSMHLWRLYGKNPMNSESEVAIAVRKIKELDPYNPVL
jgi:O-antigen ligase